MRNYNLEDSIKANPFLTYSFVVMTTATFWLATRPYVGIIMDAQLYSFQAMEKLQSAKLGGDLYLKFGSQDHFTVYGYILAYVISIMGVVAANFWVTIVGGVFWLFAVAFLAFTLFPKISDRIVAIWSVILLISSYAGGFSYAQQYQSPRLYVEAIVLVSIAFGIQRAWKRATFSLLLGLLIHPLMVLYGFGMVFVFAAFERRVLWLVPVIGVAVLACLAFLGVEPFTRLSQEINGDWWHIVAQISQNAFISEWTIIDYCNILIQINLGVLAFWCGTEIERRLLRALALVVFVSLLLSFIGADLLHNLLLVNLQFGRAVWMLAVFSNLFAGLILIRILERKGNCKYYIIFGLALYVIERFTSFEMFLTFPVLFLSTLALLQETRRGSLSKVVDLALFAVLCIVSFLTILLIYLIFKIQLGLPFRSFWFLNSSLILLTFVSIFLFFYRSKLVGFGLASLVFLIGLIGFDQRTPWEKYIEAGAKPPAPILAILSNANQIYWENGLDYLWFDLQMPSYYSNSQGWGSMFYKATAAEYQRRGEALYQLNTSDFGEPGNFPKLNRNENGPTSATYLVKVCTTLPDLDLIVLFTKVPNTPALEWTTPVPQYIDQRSNDGQSSINSLSKYYFYECKDFRSRSSDR